MPPLIASNPSVVTCSGMWAGTEQAPGSHCNRQTAAVLGSLADSMALAERPVSPPVAEPRSPRLLVANRFVIENTCPQWCAKKDHQDQSQDDRPCQGGPGRRSASCRGRQDEVADWLLG